MIMIMTKMMIFMTTIIKFNSTVLKQELEKWYNFSLVLRKKESNTI